MIVVDASVLVVALADNGAHGAHARHRLQGEDLVAPELVDLEVLSVLRRQVRLGLISPSLARQAIDDLLDLPVRRAPHGALVRRCWELRDNLTVYDAAYVALAEALGATLVTADRRLAAAPGPRCPVEIVSAG